MTWSACGIISVYESGLGSPDFKVLPVLSVHFHVPILTHRRNFAIIFRQNLEVNDLRVEAPHALLRQLRGRKYLHLRGVNARGNNVFSICRDLDFRRGDWEIKVLNELDSANIVHVLFHFDHVFAVLPDELGIGAAGGQVVDLGVVLRFGYI